jgi:hypothetical protein
MRGLRDARLRGGVATRGQRKPARCAGKRGRTAAASKFGVDGPVRAPRRKLFRASSVLWCGRIFEPPDQGDFAMFDDSKRLDALEKSVGDLKKRIDDAIVELNKHIDNFKKSDEATEKYKESANKALESIYKRFDGDEKTISADGDAIKKLQQRCANLEAVVKKLQK